MSEMSLEAQAWQQSKDRRNLEGKELDDNELPALSSANSYPDRT